MTVAASTIEALERQLRGEVIAPGHAEYDEARTMWNGTLDRRPALIVRCRGVADVVAAVRHARAERLPVATRGGGHSVSGASMPDGAMVLDMRAMNGVRIDPARRRACVGPGTLWGDLDHEAQAFGLATTGGVHSRTGVAGLTLGGGIGYLARAFGLTADNLMAADIVTADGSLRHVSESENADVLWALWGGSGSLGVVTSFELQLHPVGPEVMVAQVFHPFENAYEALRFYRDFSAQAPDEVGCYALIVHVPPVAPFPEAFHGQMALALLACYAGPVEEGESALEALRGFGDPILDASQAMPYTALQSAFDAGYPDGARYYWKSCFLSELPDAAIRDLVEVVPPLPGPYTAVFLEPMGGAINRVAPDATAFPHRTATCNLGISAGWSDPGDDERITRWVRAVHDAMASHATGGTYVNYLDRDERERAASAYGDNLARLRDLKSRHDPDGIFLTPAAVKAGRPG